MRHKSEIQKLRFSYNVIEENIGLRIDNRRQSMDCGIFLCSVAIACIITYYVWNKRLFFSPSDHIIDTMIGFVFQKILI